MNRMNEEESNDKDNDAKIALIQFEVIGKQYSSDNFNYFLQKKKGKENIILSEFSIEELRSFIAEFQQNGGKDEIENGGRGNLQSLSKSIMLKDENDNYISTYKQSKTILSDYQHLTIIISNPFKITTFLFFGAEYQFTIEVAELSSKVMRTYADFWFLKDTLEMYYPTTYIPPLPSIAYITPSNENYLKRKANYLVMFLNSLTQNSLIMSTQLFLDFLQLSKEDFAKVKNYYDETDPPTVIKKFYTLEGLINANIDPAKEELAEKIRNNLLSKDKQYKRLNSALKDLMNEFTVISDKMNKVSIAFREIAKEHNDIPFVQQTYLNFEELTKRYANSYLNQQLVFREDIQQYFKYTLNHFLEFRGVLDELKKKKNEYLKSDVPPEKKCLLNKRELKKIDHMQKSYGYCLNKTIDEHQRLLYITSEAMKSHLQDINSKREKLFGDYLSMASLLEIKNEEEVKIN